MLRVLLVLALASLATAASAEVIVIDVQSASGANEGLPYSVEGWTFTDTSIDSTSFAALDAGGSVLSVFVGPLADVGEASFRAARDDGAPFDLHGFAEMSGNLIDGSFEVVGSNGARFALPTSGPVFLPAAFSGLAWFEVRSLRAPSFTSVALDGIALEVSAVPEPRGLAWLVPVAAVLAARRRSRP